MNKMLMFILLVVLSLTLIVGFSVNKTVTLEEPIDLLITAEPVNNDIDQLKFEISTNLPDGTIGNITIHNLDGSFTEDDDFVVEDGKAETEYFGYINQELPRGTYEVNVTTPFSYVQSDEVIAEIGDDYSKYKGGKFRELIDGVDKSRVDKGRFIDYSFEIIES